MLLRLFIAALWSPAGKGLALVCDVKLYFKAVVASPAGPASAVPLFGRVCSPPCPFFLLAHFTLCLPFIDAIINNAHCACHQLTDLAKV